MNKDNMPLNGDTYSLGSGLSIYTKEDIKNSIKITNNRAHYFANLAKKFRDEAKIHCENAKHYAEENSNVTYDQMIDLRNVLESEINKKQEVGDYALRKDLPVNVSELANDSKYVTKTEMDTAVDSVLPSQEGLSDSVLIANGGTLSWRSFASEPLFSLKLFDHILSFEESKGYALQGTWVYKESAPERYGYPNFYVKCLDEKNSGEATEFVFGENTITIYVNPNGHKYYDIADKDVIDAVFNDVGIAWFYGIDEDNKRVFLPRNNHFLQVTTELDKLGNSIEAGLPNITGEVKGTQIFFQGRNVDGNVGAITTVQTGTVNLSSGGGAQSFNSLSFDASMSNSIYGKSSTVQPASNLNALYFVVGNSEKEEFITEVTEVTTSDNDTIPLFASMYFDFAPNNASWLKAGQQANSGGIYTSCYNTLVNCLNGENPYHLKVIDEAVADLEESMFGEDYSEYWKVNSVKNYFITPLSISNVGELNLQLYFKVANAVQNLELINAGEVLEALADKIGYRECKAYIIETYQNGSSWYRIWSDGWCEQGGIYSDSASLGGGDSRTYNINLLKTYKDSSINMSATTNMTNRYAFCRDNTVSSFTLGTRNVNSSQGSGATTICWVVAGYLAEGEY